MTNANKATKKNRKDRVYDVSKRKRKTWQELSQEIEAGEREEPGGDLAAYGQARKTGDREHGERRRRNDLEAKAKQKKTPSSKKAAEGAAKNVKALANQRKTKYRQWRATVGESPLDTVLLDLLAESDARLRKMRRAIHNDPSVLPDYLEYLRKRVGRAAYAMEIKRFSGGDKDLAKILRGAAQGLRPTRKLIYKIKRRLRKMPAFVQRLYAVERMTEILREIQSDAGLSEILDAGAVEVNSSHLPRIIKQLVALRPWFSTRQAQTALSIGSGQDHSIDFTFAFQAQEGIPDLAPSYGVPRPDYDWDGGPTINRGPRHQWPRRRKVPDAALRRYMRLLTEFRALLNSLIGAVPSDYALNLDGLDDMSTPVSRKRRRGWTRLPITWDDRVRADDGDPDAY